MNRGVARRSIFNSVGDRQFFLDTLMRTVGECDVELHAYALMRNHFHLLLYCPEGGLSESMQLFGSTYVRGFNGAVGRDGPLFRSRFKSVLVRGEGPVAAVGRYIHRNHLETRRPDLLRAYEWSSYRHYVADVPPPPGLVTDVLLGLSGGRTAMRSFVEGDEQPFSAASEVLWWASVQTAFLDADQQHVSWPRVITLAIFDQLSPSVRAELLPILGYSSSRGLRCAIDRARARVEHEPQLAQLVAIANDRAA